VPAVAGRPEAGQRSGQHTGGALGKEAVLVETIPAP